MILEVRVQEEICGETPPPAVYKSGFPPNNTAGTSYAFMNVTSRASMYIK